MKYRYSFSEHKCRLYDIMSHSHTAVALQVYTSVALSIHASVVLPLAGARALRRSPICVTECAGKMQVSVGETFIHKPTNVNVG